MLVFLSGLLAGALHVLAGPDHLSAVAPLAVRAPRAASALGAAWGVGHGGGVLAWFVLARVGRTLFGAEPEPAAIELLVGVSLIALGLVRSRAAAVAAPPAHGRLLAFGFGLLHGSAGASHLLSLLPALGLPAVGVLSYAAGYLAAGVLAMVVAAATVGRISMHVSDLTVLRRVVAALAVAVGTIWLAQAVADLRS